MGDKGLRDRARMQFGSVGGSPLSRCVYRAAFVWQVLGRQMVAHVVQDGILRSFLRKTNVNQNSCLTESVRHGFWLTFAGWSATPAHRGTTEVAAKRGTRPAAGPSREPVTFHVGFFGWV